MPEKKLKPAPIRRYRTISVPPDVHHEFVALAKIVGLSQVRLMRLLLDAAQPSLADRAVSAVRLRQQADASGRLGERVRKRVKRP